MGDHLPECPISIGDIDITVDGTPMAAIRYCACSALRACEERVLNAARGAVEGEWTEDPSWDGTNWNNALTCALAAIDALRHKP